MCVILNDVFFVFFTAGCPTMGSMSVHDHEKCKSDRMRKKLGLQQRSRWILCTKLCVGL